MGVKYSGVQQSGGLISSSPSGAGGSYFYHSDHLGSSSLITDANGNITQHVEYVPFGEVFVEERNSNWSTPYLFNGKERDAETGLSYYGARYYDPRTSVWLSVDPLAEKYVGWSAYNYTLNNPINNIDPDGKRSTRPSQSGNQNYRNNNQYARYGLYPNGQMPPSYNKTTTFRPRNRTNPNGAIPIVNQPAPGKQYPAYVKSITTAGGNEVQITPSSTNNNITSLIEFSDNMSFVYNVYKEMFKISTDVIYTESGARKSSPQIILLDPVLIKMQQDYDMAAAKINNTLGPIDFSTATSPTELIQLGADRHSYIQSVLGLSPIDIIQQDMLHNHGNYEVTNETIRVIPEFRQGN